MDSNGSNVLDVTPDRHRMSLNGLHDVSIGNDKPHSTREERLLKRFDVDKIHTCKLCHKNYQFKDFEKHKRTEEHRLAAHSMKKAQVGQRRQMRSITPLSTPDVPKPIPFATRIDLGDITLPFAIPINVIQDKCVKIEEVETPDNECRKEKYYIRPWCNNLPEANQQYQNTLLTYLALKHSLSGDFKTVKISSNDLTWKKFGDIVVEVTDNNDMAEIYAIQCKQVLGKNKSISAQALLDEKAKFSIKRQCDTLSTLKKKKNFAKTNFVLFTASGLEEATNKKEIVYNDEALENWKSESNKKLWRNRKLLATFSKKDYLISTTNDSDDFYIFRIFKDDNTVVEDADLKRFGFLVNQKREKALKNAIQNMIQHRFGASKNITRDLIQFVEKYFKREAVVHKYCYKLTNNDILLEIADLLLSPYVLTPDTTLIEEQHYWQEAINNFDLIIVNKSLDIVNKMYSRINFILKNIVNSDLDVSRKVLTIDKCNRNINERLKEFIFHTSLGDKIKINVNDLYKILWKTSCAPLVLLIKEETDLILVMKIVDCLKTLNVPSRYILATDLEILIDVYIPNNVTTFRSFKDLEEINPRLYEEILKFIRVPVLDVEMSLEHILDYNKDFARKITPEVFLNMLFGSFSFLMCKQYFTESNDIESIVLSDSDVDNVTKNWRERKTEDCLVYNVSVRGKMNRQIAIPPNI